MQRGTLYRTMIDLIKKDRMKYMGVFRLVGSPALGGKAVRLNWDLPYKLARSSKG